MIHFILVSIDFCYSKCGFPDSLCDDNNILLCSGHFSNYIRRFWILFKYFYQQEIALSGLVHLSQPTFWAMVLKRILFSQPWLWHSNLFHSLFYPWGSHSAPPGVIHMNGRHVPRSTGAIGGGQGQSAWRKEGTYFGLLFGTQC